MSKHRFPRLWVNLNVYVDHYHNGYKAHLAPRGTAPEYLSKAEYIENLSDLLALQEKYLHAVEVLKFIGSGCLVLPDGGSPNLSDAIEAANQALNKINGGNVADKVAENTVNIARSIHDIGGPRHAGGR